jgi:hypothetical protein
MGDQRRFIRGWIQRNHLFALARHTISVRRAAAFAAGGLT